MHKVNKLLSVLFLFITIPLLAQEKEEHHHMAPPPLNDQFFNWMVGEWKGKTTSPNGETADYLKCEIGLDGQFLVMTYKADLAGKPLMSGIGMVTLDKEGNETGYWVDSMRSMAQGKGIRKGNTSIFNWTMAAGAYVRTTEKVDENTMKVSGVMTMPDGSEMHSESLLKRVKK
jgi:hypothetical protein